MTQNPSEEYKNSRLYRSRYNPDKRPAPKQCPVLKKDGTRCKNKCVIGYNICMNHGGRGAKASIKHGSYSKLVQYKDMLKFNSLSKREKEQLAVESYTKENILDSSLYLSHLQINRLLETQAQLMVDRDKYRHQLRLLQESAAPPRECEVLVSHISGLDKEINTTAKIIQAHQAQWNNTLKTKKELREKAESDELLQQIASTLGEDPKILLGGLVRAYLDRDPDCDMDELLALPESEQEMEIAYEECEDD